MTVKMQHYVPRSYLRKFAISGTERLFCYNLRTGKVINADIGNIGGEQHFYDFNAPNQPFEEYLEAIESSISKIYRAILIEETVARLSPNEREQIAIFLIVQFSRTRHFREFIKDWTKANRDGLLGSNPSSNDEEFISNIIRSGNQELEIKGIQKTVIMRLISDLTPLVLRMKWIIFKNQTRDPFITSDNPISMFIPKEFPGSTMVGFERKGIQIYFPLNPSLCLCICDPTSYDQQGLMQISEPQEIDFINGLQVNSANRHVFSSEGDFSIIRRMKANQ